MDEAASCDVLVLLREGAIVAHESPEAIRERTGTDDMSEAFVRLIEQAGA
jgi:ABC-2 type transport system ATP-binding protein